ncbi:MAG: tail fiber protein [Reyranellaceae bacterium]
MSQRILLCLVAAILGSASPALSQPCPVGGLTTLVNGTTADATAVNNNFAYVANCVNSSAAGAAPTGSIVAFTGFTLPSGWLWANGQAVSRASYPALLAALTKSSTVTITIAAPGVVTWTSHGLTNGWPLQFSTMGNLPTGITAGTTYYVVGATINSFQLASLPGGAAITTSGTQSGTQTATFAPYGNGDGFTTFAVPDLRGRSGFGLDNLGGASAAGRISGLSGVYGGTPGAGGGEEMHVLITGEMPAHNHGVTDPQHSHNFPNLLLSHAGGTYWGAFAAGTFNIYDNPAASASSTGITIQNSGGGGPHNNMPPALMVNYIIKY